MIGTAVILFSFFWIVCGAIGTTLCVKWENNFFMACELKPDAKPNFNIFCLGPIGAWLYMDEFTTIPRD